MQVRISLSFQTQAVIFVQVKKKITEHFIFSHVVEPQLWWVCVSCLRPWHLWRRSLPPLPTWQPGCYFGSFCSFRYSSITVSLAFKQTGPTSCLMSVPLVCKLFSSIKNLLYYYYKNSNWKSPEVFNVWNTGYKELWTNYQRTWNTEVCSCSVIMGDSTCHSSDLSGVSVLHKLLHTLITFTTHHLLYIKQTICVGSVSLTVSSTLSLLISPNQDSAYQTTFTLVEMEPVCTFSRKVISEVFFPIGPHWETEVVFKCLKEVKRV